MLNRVTRRGVAAKPAKSPNRLEHPDCSGLAHLGASMGVPGQTGSCDLARSSPDAAISDGRLVSEWLTEYTAPHRFAYWRSGFPNTPHHLAERLWVAGDRHAGWIEIILPIQLDTTQRYAIQRRLTASIGWVNEINGATSKEARLLPSVRAQVAQSLMSANLPAGLDRRTLGYLTRHLQECLHSSR
jgi:hypothetical protein